MSISSISGQSGPFGVYSLAKVGVAVFVLASPLFREKVFASTTKAAVCTVAVCIVILALDFFRNSSNEGVKKSGESSLLAVKAATEEQDVLRTCQNLLNETSDIKSSEEIRTVVESVISSLPKSSEEKNRIQQGVLKVLLPGDELASAEAFRAGSSVSISRNTEFLQVDSSQLIGLFSEKTLVDRRDFLTSGIDLPSPLIGASSFVSDQMVTHLMRDKKDFALGVKYVSGDSITNMEAALHTFVIPLCRVFMTGDFHWMGEALGIKGSLFGRNQVREVILSASIHPDFELSGSSEVCMPLVEVKDEPVVGKALSLRDIPTRDQKRDERSRSQYEEGLKKHMVYHLSPDHRIPARRELGAGQIMTVDEAVNCLEALIKDPKEGRFLKDKFLRVKGKIISLEILFRIYEEQLQNEFRVLNTNTPQGYVYTINPPSIFTKELGGDGTKILNRLQALAFSALARKNPSLFSNMKILGFNNYSDREMVNLFKFALPLVNVLKWADLWNKDYKYQGPPKLALVLHNNSDGLGQNIETEGPSSLDGVLGCYSSAAVSLKRNRADLVSQVIR